MSKRRRQAAWGRPCLPQPALASPAVGSPPTGRTSRCKLVSLVLLLALSPLSTLLAQAGGGRASTPSGPTSGTISGVVTAQETGAPLPGARVMVAGTDLAADAAADGRYTIASVPPGTYRLRARLIGHALMEMTDVVVAAGDTARADFRLTPLAVTLQEVVVVGYGTQARRDVTGSVASVSGEDVHAVPKANAIEAIKGRVPGVDIVTSGNNPGDGISIRVRGTRSLTASNDPLYVLDGIPMAGGIGDLNPNDIESIEILKDASATAIYGARGASGVVLITTKQGKAGKTTITYDTYAGTQQALRGVPMMNGPQWAQFKRDAARNSNTGYQCPASVAACAHGDSILFWPQDLQALTAGRWTDWQDLVLHPGTQLSNEVRVTGGDEKTRFALSGGQLNQRGIVKGMDFVRRSVRFNFDHRPNARLRVGTSTSVIQSDQHLGRGDGVYSEALGNDPLGMPYDSAGNLLFKPTPDGQRVNPLSDIANQKDDRARARAFGTLFADYNLSAALNWRVNFGADLTFFRRGQFWGSQTQEQQRTLAYTLDNILTYKRSLGVAHRIDATLVYSLQTQRTEDQVTSVIGLPYEQDQYFDLGAAARVDAPSSYVSQWALASFMARLNYALKDRYLLTLTSRDDCSSRLAPGHKCQVFPSAAIAWRLSEEGFIQQTGLFSDLKLRISHGRTGNTAINPYQTEGSLTRTIYSFGDQPAVGYRPGSFVNSTLSWERTTQTDVGLEFTARSGRISGSVDVYRASTSDLLMNRQLSGINGRSSILQNVGATRNSGVEVALSTQILRDWHDLAWSTQLNWSMNRNRIVVLVGAEQADDAVTVHRPVELRAPGEVVPIPQDLSGEGHLDAAVPGRPDVLQNAGTAVDAGQLPVHEKVARRRAIDVDGARDAATPRGEFEPDICLGRPLPRQRAVDKAARTVSDRRLVAKRVDGPGERPLGLIGIDRGVPRSPMADPQLQVGKEPRLLDEAFLGEAPGDRGRGKYLTLVSRRQARGAVVAAGEREEVAVLERVVEARHEGGQGPLRHVARGRVDPRRRPQVEVLVLLVRQPDHGRDLIFSPLRLEAVHECSVDAMSHAQAALVGQDVIERVGERALLLQVRVGGAALLRLSLGAPELPATKERQVRPEVHPPIERGAQVVIGEQGPERARAGPVVLLVRDVGERVDALPVGRGLEQQVARAVVGHPQRVIPECFTVHAVAAAQVLVALDHRGRGADAQTGIGAMVEVEPHRPTHEVHPFDDAPLIELASTEREAGLLVTACNPHLVAQLRPRMQHEVLPVRPAPGGERLEVLGPEA